jgi:hypothetical protein
MDENDEILEGAFPKRKGSVDVVSWQETEEIEYRLYFGRLSQKWGIASWGLVTLNRGAMVGQVTYDNRPREFTRDGLATWLVDSGVDAYSALQLADLAVEARADLFPGEQSSGDDPASDSVGPWGAPTESSEEEAASATPDSSFPTWTEEAR